MNELRETVVKVVFYTLFKDLEQVHYGLETHLQDACRNPSAFPVSQGLKQDILLGVVWEGGAQTDLFPILLPTLIPFLV